MTLEQLLDRRATRNIFFALIALAVIVLMGVRYFVLPDHDPSLSQGKLPFLAKILEDLSTTLIVTVAVTVLLKWLTPSRVRNSGATIIEPRELKYHFADALTSSNEWRFSGGCGRYFRSAVLKEMARRATLDSSHKAVTAIILNPENDALCEQHARYRAGTRRGKNEGIWTKTRVKQELLATIVLTKKSAYTSGLLRARILTSDHFSTFRVDISQACAIETREDPTAPALRSDSGSYFYDALADEHRLLAEQAREIVNGEAECHVVNDLSSLKAAIKAMDINLLALRLSDEDLAGILELIHNATNPYE